MHWGLHFPKQYGSRVMQQILKCNSLWKCHTYKPGARRHQFYRSDQMSVQVAMSGPESDPLFLANVGVAEGCFWHQWSVIFSLVQVAISLTLRHEVSMERVTIVSMAIFSTFSGFKQKPQDYCSAVSACLNSTVQMMQSSVITSHTADELQRILQFCAAQDC